VLSPLSDHQASAGDPGLAVSINWVHGAVVLRGELDRHSAHHLVDALGALAATDHRCWVVDAADVTWCDAGGLRALAAAHAMALESGRELRLVQPSRCVDRLVTLTGLDRLIADGVPPVVPVPATGTPKVDHRGRRPVRRG
jgi:anti-sigma B factor antagonist